MRFVGLAFRHRPALRPDSVAEMPRGAIVRSQHAENALLALHLAEALITTLGLGK